METLKKPPLTVEVYLDNTYDKEVLSHDLEQNHSSIPWSSWLHTWLDFLYLDLPMADSYELTLKFVSDRQMQILNHQYRQQDKPTDVLAFAALEANLPKPNDSNYLLEPLYLGDIVISLDTAIEQAKQQQHPLIDELGWLASHGLLHLLGWDHPDNSSLQEMLYLQAKLLKSVSIIT